MDDLVLPNDQPTNKMSGRSHFRTKQTMIYYTQIKEYKEYVNKGTDEALRIMCEAEANRDLLAVYAYTSEEAYQEWFNADKEATNAERVYYDWLKEKHEIDEEYYEVIDDIDRCMFVNDER